MKKSLAALALAGSITFIGSVPAMATAPATYPAPTQEGVVSEGTVAPGEPFTFSGEGMTAGEDVEVTVTETGTPLAIGGSFAGGASMAVPAKIVLPLAPQIFITKARADGTFAIPLTLPADGTYTLTARGLTSGKTVTATITVDAAAARERDRLAGTATNSGLADTGADAGLVLWSLVGAGALAAGVASVVVVRRRGKGDRPA